MLSELENIDLNSEVFVFKIYEIFFLLSHTTNDRSRSACQSFELLLL